MPPTNRETSTEAMPETVKKSVEEAIVTKSETPPPPLPEEEEKIRRAMAEVDFHDRNSVIRFGSAAQEKLDEISNRMIEGVKNKDTGVAGESLNKWSRRSGGSTSTPSIPTAN